MVNSKISINGDLGSGKTSVSRSIAEQLGWDVISTGSIQRKIAKEMDMSTLELNKYAESNPEIDKKIDKKLKKVGQSKDQIVLDSRLAWFFVPDSFKVYLQVTPKIAAKRIYCDSERQTEAYTSPNEALRDVKSRKKSENKRYMELYGVNPDKMSNYDAVIDTSFNEVKKISELILTLYELRKNESSFPRTWLSPLQLLPTQDVRGLSSHTNSDNSSSDISAINFSPLITIQVDDTYYVYDGHNRLSKALNNNLNFVPTNVLAKDDEKIFSGMTAELYSRTNFKKSWVYDWEDLHNIKYPIHP